MSTILSPFRSLIAALTFAALLIGMSPTISAEDPIRIWVDSSGRFSVEATLLELHSDHIVLLRRDGGRTLMQIDRLSKRDRKYLDEFGQQIAINQNTLRLAAPAEPKIKPLARLDLPAATFEAPAGSKLAVGAPTQSLLQTDLPTPLVADASPDQIEMPQMKIGMDKVDTYDSVSSPISVGTIDQPAIGMSISAGFSLRAKEKNNRLIKFDASDTTPREVYRSDKTIKLFDHHVASGHSLVLIDHNPLGHGGSLAIATGWENDKVTISHKRDLPGSISVGRFPFVRWARWIDEEHFIAVMDKSIVGWNIISGKRFMQIDGIDEKSVPAISGGRRYLAVPTEGAVCLFNTVDGKPLGRIGVEANTVPGVSFSRHGHALAIVNSRRMRAWDLQAAALNGDVTSRRSLGRNAPVWVDSDLVLCSSGVMVSLFRGVPVWRYEITGASAVNVGNRVAFFRKHPDTSLTVTDLPHDGVNNALEWIDASPRATDGSTWQIPGRSVWHDQTWSDHDVRVSTQSATRR